MQRALQLDLHGPESFIREIEAVDEDGQTMVIEFDQGDPSVGIASGWVIAGPKADNTPKM